MNILGRLFSRSRRRHRPIEIDRSAAQDTGPWQPAHAIVGPLGDRRPRGTARGDITAHSSKGEWLYQIRRDLRHALRALIRAPVFAVVAVATLAIGIGATTVMFSIVDQIVLRPLPYPAIDRLVVIRERIAELSKAYPTVPANPSHFLAWQSQCTGCEDVAALRPAEVTLSGAGDPERVGAVFTSANLFPMLGAKAVVGRLITQQHDDLGGGRSVVLSNRLWRSHFNADPSVIGRAISVNNTQYIVQGVLAPNFYFPKQSELGELVTLPKQTDLFMQLALSPEERREPSGDFSFAVLARMKSGVGIDRISAQLNAIENRISASLPRHTTLSVVVTPLQDQIVGASGRRLMLLLGAVGAVLLIVCVNLANLLLARNLARQREAAVRLALGADRGRLVRQVLTEGIALALAGGIVGLILAHWGLSYLLRFAPENLPRTSAVHLDIRIVAFGLFSSIAAGIAFGILPALRLGAADPADALKSDSRGATAGVTSVRTSSLLVGSQACLTTILLATTALLLISFARVLHVDKGFTETQTLAFDIVLPAMEYGRPPLQHAFYDRILTKLRSLPGATSAAVTNTLPLEGESEIRTLNGGSNPLPPGQRPTTNVRIVSPDYFRTLGIAVRRGRTFHDADRGSHVVMLSERVARLLWPHTAPIGKRLSLGKDTTTNEVIGVVPDVPTSNLESRGSLVVYIPYWQSWLTSATLLVRTGTPPASAANSVRALLRSVAPNTPVSRFRTISDVIASAISPRKFQVALLAIFALSALLIGSVGIYGVVGHSVARRSRELSVRMALGARPINVYGLVLKGGLTPVLIGAAVGLAGSLVVGRVAASLLFEAHTSDSIIAGIVATVLLAAAGGLACYVPSRRVVRKSIGEVLRGE